MKLRQITIGDLPEFVLSDEYSRLAPKPITRLRAISQSKNPDAKQSDIALVYISEGNTLLAFAGLLPHSVNGHSLPIYSNSGWWAHPDFGRKQALPVFLNAFQNCEKRMFFTDCTAHTKSILEKTGLFRFPAPMKGARFFLRFYFGSLVQKKKKWMTFKPIAVVVDEILNAFLSIFYSLWMKRPDDDEFSSSLANELSPELDSFIRQHSKNQYLKQSVAKLNWIIQNPWVSDKKKEVDPEYPFTSYVESFSQQFLILKKQDTVEALFMFSVRDNHMSVPFAYYEKSALAAATKEIWRFALMNKVNSLIIYNEELKNAIQKMRPFRVHQQKIIRFTGYSKELNSIFTPGKKIQDGEADVSFT